MSARMRRENFFLVILLVAISGCFRRPCPPTPPPADFDELINGRITFINFEPHEIKEIKQALAPLTTRRCGEAFNEANLRSPRQVILETGAVFRPSSDLYLYSYIELGLTHPQIRKSYAMEFSSGYVQAGTVSPKLYGVQRTIDGRPRFFLHETAFLGESFLFNTLSLHDVLVHEFIHAGGQPPTPGWFFQHDLAGFPPYDKIMEACK